MNKLFEILRRIFISIAVCFQIYMTLMFSEKVNVNTIVTWVVSCFALGCMCKAAIWIISPLKKQESEEESTDFSC